MGYANGVITAPVSFADVQRALGVTARNLDEICKSGKINKWSLHKPVSYPKLFPSGGEQWRGDADSTIWGMRVDIINDADTANGAKDVYESGNFPHYNYTWDKPVGTANSPYRLADFDGYLHTAGGIYIQDMKMGTVERVYVSNTAAETEMFTFTVFGSKTGGVGFSDIESTVKVESRESLRLVVSVYKRGTNELIGEYFNDSIKMYDYGARGTLDSSYDSGDSYKSAGVRFSKSVYWGNGKSEVDVYLSLQTVMKESTPAGTIYHAEKIVALPYTNNKYYKKSFIFSVASRYIRAVKIHDGATSSGTRNWIDISSSKPIRLYDNAGTPDMMFEVSKIPGESLRFQNGKLFLRSKYVKSDGSLVTVSGTLTSQSGSAIPAYVDVPAGGSGVVNVYWHFGNMLQESHSTGYYPAGQYTCDIFLVRQENGSETETKVTSVTIYTK